MDLSLFDGGGGFGQSPGFHTAMHTQKTPHQAGFFVCGFFDQSPRVSNDALPPAAVVFTVTTFSVAKRSR